LVQIFKENQQFIIILLFWLLTGMYGGPLIFGIVPVFLILMFQKGFYSELLIGFWFIIILSDSYENRLEFAKNLKNIYILSLGLIFFLKIKVFSPLSYFFLIFTPFLLISFLSTIFYSPTIDVALQKYLSYFLIILIVPNYTYLSYRKDGNIFFKKLIYFVAIILLVGIVFQLMGSEISYIKGGRYRGIFGNPNGIGLFCFSTITLFVIIINIQKNLFSNFEKIFFFALIFLSVLWSGSRNNSVSIFIFLTSIFFFKKHFLLGLTFVLLSLFLYNIIEGNYVQIIKSLGLESFFRLETLEAGGGRYVAWNFAWNEIQNNFILGQGFSYDEYLMKKNYRLLSALGHEGNVHNSYLSFWLNSGIIGLIFYLTAFLYCFVKAHIINQISFPYMFAILFTASFESWLVASLNPYTIVLLICLTILSDKYFAREENNDLTEVTLT